MSVLILSNITIRRDTAGGYCLDDLHRAAGEARRHRPKCWLENQQTRGLVAEAAIGGIPPIQRKQGLGTFVCRELVYTYATWISPAFHMKIIRAYDALVAQALKGSAFGLHRILNDPAAMRRLLLSYRERVLGLEDTATRLAPIVDADNGKRQHTLRPTTGADGTSPTLHMPVDRLAMIFRTGCLS